MPRKSVGRIEIARKHADAAARLSPEAASWFCQLLAASVATVEARHAGLAGRIPPHVRRELAKAWILDEAGWFLPAKQWCEDVAKTREVWRDEKRRMRRDCPGPDSGQEFRAGHAETCPGRTFENLDISTRSENVRAGHVPYRTRSRAPGSILDHQLRDLDAPIVHTKTTTTTTPAGLDLDLDRDEGPSLDDPESMRRALELARARLSPREREEIEKSTRGQTFALADLLRNV